MKKITAACLIAATMLLLLTSCKSTLRPALEEYERINKVEELDLSLLFDEEQGFHYKGIKWGMTLEEAQKASDSTISSILGYGPHNIMIYESNLKLKLLDRQNDTSSLASVTEDDICYMVSLAFNQDSKRLTNPLTEAELFDQYLVKLKEAFGEPDDFQENTQVQERVSTVSRSYVWNYETPDGKQTQLQWSAAYVSGSEEPSIVTIGVVYHHPALDKPVEEESTEQ